jgi:Uma2 family endonuclease
MIRTLAEETDTPLVSVGSTTLRDEALGAAVEADESFYTTNAVRMRQRQEIDLAVDPPPDLAIEVEVTRRLGERRLIYRDMGVPELWRYADGELIVLLKHGDEYVAADRSPTFPQLSPREMAEFVAAGIEADETPWGKGFRRRVREVLAAG